MPFIRKNTPASWPYYTYIKSYETKKLILHDMRQNKLQLYHLIVTNCRLKRAYLGPCVYLGPSFQQQPHHVAVPTFGGYVQRCYVVLKQSE